MQLTSAERDILTQLQRGIAIERSPFSQHSLPASDVIQLLQHAQAQGWVRRFGGVFDSRKLGYKSMLCCVVGAEDRLEEAAAMICEHAGVTHCYERRPITGEQDYPRLWFTIAMLAESFDSGMETLQRQLAPMKIIMLPALQRFKVEVVFDLRKDASEKSRAQTYRPTSGNKETAIVPLTDHDRKLIRLVGDNLPITEHPFDAIAEKMGMDVTDVLGKLQHWKRKGALRRIAPILYHRKAGFTANGMCVWKVSGDVEEIGRKVATRPEVTHCYQRPRVKAFPFDLYAMIHAGSVEALQNMFRKISVDCGLQDGILLLSSREFKKSSMQYFERET